VEVTIYSGHIALLLWDKERYKRLDISWDETNRKAFINIARNSFENQEVNRRTN
jgi:hypothetical protein